MGGRSKARPAASGPARETDLYAPVRAFLEARGYTVRSEVLDCDVTATRGDELLVVELKRSLGTELLVQATQRQRAAESVYVAVPRPRGAGRGGRWHGLLHLLRRLELGLLVVSFSARRRPRVEVVLHPLPFDRKRNTRGRRAILVEIAGRSGDYNEGGSTRRSLVTAYRENALFIACALERHGSLSPRALRALGTGEKTLSILHANVYGWFERVGRALYELRPTGRAGLEHYAELAIEYRTRVEAASAGPADTPAPDTHAAGPA